MSVLIQGVLLKSAAGPRSGKLLLTVIGWFDSEGLRAVGDVPVVSGCDPEATQAEIVKQIPKRNFKLFTLDFPFALYDTESALHFYYGR